MFTGGCMCSSSVWELTMDVSLLIYLQTNVTYLVTKPSAGMI